MLLSIRPQSTEAQGGPLISALFCPQQWALSAGNGSSEVEGKHAGLGVHVLTKPAPPSPLQRILRRWHEGWVQAGMKLGRVCKLADILADKVGRA